MSHPLDRVKCRPKKWSLLAERGELHRWPNTFITTRERAGTLSCDILEVVEAHREAKSSVVVERRKLKSGHTRIQAPALNRAG